MEQRGSGPTNLMSSPRKSVWCWASAALRPVPGYQAVANVNASATDSIRHRFYRKRCISRNWRVLGSQEAELGNSADEFCFKITYMSN